MVADSQRHWPAAGMLKLLEECSTRRPVVDQCHDSTLVRAARALRYLLQSSRLRLMANPLRGEHGHPALSSALGSFGRLARQLTEAWWSAPQSLGAL